MTIDLSDTEERFLRELLEQLIVQMEDVERSQIMKILRDSLPGGVRLYEDDLEEAAGEAGIDDPERVLSDLEDREVLERWTETSSLSAMGIAEGLDEDKQIEKQMLSVDEDVLDRLFEGL